MLIQRLSNTFKRYKDSKKEQASTQRYIKHNRSVFKSRLDAGAESGEILCELNGLSSSIIGYSYLAASLVELHGGTIVGYLPTEKDGQRYDTGARKGVVEQDDLPRWILQPGVAISVFRNWVARTATKYPVDVYQSFGMEKVVVPRLTPEAEINSASILDKLDRELVTVRDLEALIVEGVYVGDLIYDSHMRSDRVPTVDLASAVFRSALRHAVRTLVFWINYFKSNTVLAVNVSHCCYLTAIPLRVAVSLDIPVYQTTGAHMYRLDKDNMFAYTEFRFYRKMFAELSVPERQHGLRLGKELLEQRLGGEAVEVGPSQVSTKSAWGARESAERLLSTGSETKVLLAPHCFFDSPHGMGNMLFPDFLEWVDFVGNIARETNYAWYIKTHPDFIEKTQRVLNEIVLPRHPIFQLLPITTSHEQILREGIDVGLTMYGTLGVEYAARGVPVINASLNNPHISYGFNLHPRSVEEYGNLLRNLHQIDLEIDMNEVYEYYYMRNVQCYSEDQTWLFSEQESMVNAVGGYYEQFTPRVYDYWLQNEWSVDRHEQVLGTVGRFIRSGEFMLDGSVLRSSKTRDPSGGTST